MIHYGELLRAAMGGFAADVHIKEARLGGGGGGVARQTELSCAASVVRSGVVLCHFKSAVHGLCMLADISH